MTTVSTPRPQTRRPGAIAWFRLIQAESKMVIRDTAGMIIPLGMPLLILVMQAISIDNLDAEIADGITALDYYVLPVIVTMVVATIAVINMPSFLATYRKTKMLRRLSVTPASPAMVLVAQMVVSFAQVLIGIAIAYAVALIFFDANLPQSLGTAVLVLLACCAALYGVGMIVSSIAPTPNAAVAFGLIFFFGLAAMGGMFGPVENLPQAVQDISSWLPFAASVEAFQSAWSGESVDAQNWLVLGLTTVVGGSIAGIFFRWE